MPRFGPISRRNLRYYLRLLGFEGPYAGGKHEMMVKGELRLRIPNLHTGDIDRNLLGDILRQAGISLDEWENL